MTTTASEYVHVGRHADILANGRHLAPGDRINPDELDLGKHGEDQHLIDEGRLVDGDQLGKGASNEDFLDGKGARRRTTATVKDGDH